MSESAFPPFDPFTADQLWLEVQRAFERLDRFHPDPELLRQYQAHYDAWAAYFVGQATVQ